MDADRKVDKADPKTLTEDDRERAAYRKKRYYTGYEDYTPSGREALRAYQGPKPNNTIEARDAAQKTQKEYNTELVRESRHGAPPERLKDGGMVSHMHHLKKLK